MTRTASGGVKTPSEAKNPVYAAFSSLSLTISAWINTKIDVSCNIT